MAKRLAVTATINGVETAFLCEPRQTLLEVLREELGLMGTKEGCGNGNCGACTVIMEGRTVNSCLVLAAEAQGKTVVTVEGLAQPGRLHPLQQAFIQNVGFQCGFCTPGFLMSARAFLDHNPQPGEPEIRRAIAGNLCRCTGYEKIVAAVQQAARELKPES